MTRAFAARAQRQPAGGLGGGDPIDQGRAALDQPMHLAVDGIDFLAQAVESRRIHAGRVIPLRQRRYYVRPARVKARTSGRLRNSGDVRIEPSPWNLSRPACDHVNPR